MKSMRGSLILLLVACLWGSTITIQGMAGGKVDVFTFQMLRGFLGALTLTPVVLCGLWRKKRRPDYVKPTAEERRSLWIGGMCCGLALAAAAGVQYLGISMTSSGSVGFVAAMYILFVPLLGLFFGRRVTGRVWCSVGIALVALYLMAVKDGFSVSAGDLIVLASALLYAVHILCVNHFSPRADGVQLGFVQSLTVGVVYALLVPFFGTTAFAAVREMWFPIVFAGVLSNGICFTLQIIGQKFTPPTTASLIMSMESVFALLSAMVLTGTIPTLREGIGCALMLFAVLLSKLPIGRLAAHEAEN